MITEDSKPEKTVKVRVSDRWSVVHDDKRHLKGDTLTVPEHLAEQWLRYGWVEPVTTKEK